MGGFLDHVWENIYYWLALCGGDTNMETVQQSGESGITWKDVLEEEKGKPYFKGILSHIEKERAAGKAIYPSNADIFSALSLTPFSAVKVVIIGQDPYHGPGQAHGLAFSVKPGVAIPPSLRNIFQEINRDLGKSLPDNGCLTSWAEQGVLLLNPVLSVERGKPGSHRDLGWEQFTSRVITELSRKKVGLIFLLWGSQAQRKAELIDESRHTILKSTHPSPFSAHKGFLGCGHFSKANEILQKLGKQEINW